MNETARITSRRRVDFSDDLFEALVGLETLSSRVKWIDYAPILLTHDSLELGSLWRKAPLSAPRLQDTTTFHRCDGDWQVQRTIFNKRIPGGVEGVFFAVGSKWKRQMALRCRWAHGRIEVRTLDGHWDRENDWFRPPIFDVEFTRNRYASIYVGIDRMAVELLSEWGTVRRLLSDREKSTDRRAALRHLVDNFFRGPSRTDDEVWVRKHLRGRVSCQWGPFEVVIRVPNAVTLDVAETKALRDEYSKLPPEERAAWRRLIKSMYAKVEVAA